MRKKKKGQTRVIEELKKQLLIQAERLGIRERYTPLWFVEQKMIALGQILAEFYAERSNLEYEVNLLGSNKKELLIKLERLHSYIRKGETLREKYADKFNAMIDKNYKLSEYGKILRKLEEMEIKALA